MPPRESIDVGLAILVTLGALVAWLRGAVTRRFFAAMAWFGACMAAINIFDLPRIAMHLIVLSAAAAMFVVAAEALRQRKSK